MTDETKQQALFDRLDALIEREKAERVKATEQGVRMRQRIAAACSELNKLGVSFDRLADHTGLNKRVVYEAVQAYDRGEPVRGWAGVG